MKFCDLKMIGAINPVSFLLNFSSETMKGMQKAYQVAAVAVKQRFSEQRPKDLRILNKISQKDIAVYLGSYDHVEEIFQCLNLPIQINPDPEKLDAKIIFVNCSNSYDNKLINSLKKQVENGKWLVTSDWALGNFISHAFPNTIRWNKEQTKDEVISVEPSLNSLWSEVVVLGADPQWWLEASSHPIEILSSRVTIEAASHDLLVRHKAPVVAVSFDWEKGHVFHVISHFWSKRSRALTKRHQGVCTDFMEAGMRLTDDGINTVLSKTNIKPDTLNFAQLQSAATATELVVQLCVDAIKSS